MTNTVTLISDHLGSDKPFVMGNQYVIDAVINVTDFDDATTTTGTFVASANTFTRTSGTALPTNLIAGQNVIITNAADSGNNATVTFTSLAGEVLTLSAVDADETGDEITLTMDQEVIAYADFGLSTVSQVEILGQENQLLNWSVQLGTDGNTHIANHLVLRCITSSSGAQATGDCGTIRVRLHGQV
jgi:hypothetical protein|tara:strand:+ start:446 stop:1006 length:561 start_codon:yes stop_codon:yes gene_type:complete